MFALFFQRISTRAGILAFTASAAAIVLVSTASSRALAQSYDSIEPTLKGVEARRMRTPVSQAMKDPSAFQANRQVVDRYLKEYYFPQMTQPSNLGVLEKLRENLFKQYIRGARVPAASDHVRDLTLTAMRVMARKNYHPAVRYNAVLILGALDEKLPGGGGNPTPPVPLPAAAKELLDILEQNELDGVKVPFALKLGALLGLQRHAQYGISSQDGERLTKVSLALIAKKEPPAELDRDVYNWIRCQAANVLARQFAEGPDAAVRAALTSLIADGNLSLEDRCCVANLLKDMKYESAAGVDASATVAAMGDLLKSVAIDEAEKAQEYEDEALGTNFASQPDELEPKYQRRRLISRLQSISDGATSLKEALEEEERQKLQGLLATLNPIMAVAHDKGSDDLEITPKVIELEGEVRSIVDGWKKGEGAPAAEAEADFS